MRAIAAVGGNGGGLGVVPSCDFDYERWNRTGDTNPYAGEILTAPGTGMGHPAITVHHAEYGRAARIALENAFRVSERSGS